MEVVSHKNSGTAGEFCMSTHQLASRSLTHTLWFGHKRMDHCHGHVNNGPMLSESPLTARDVNVFLPTLITQSLCFPRGALPGELILCCLAGLCAEVFWENTESHVWNTLTCTPLNQLPLSFSPVEEIHKRPRSPLATEKQFLESLHLSQWKQYL